MSLNAPQGFMLIPTAIAASALSPEEMNGLNAPQGFMLIPTDSVSRVVKASVSRLNAPQGFMLIPTRTRAISAGRQASVLMPLRASCSFQQVSYSQSRARAPSGVLMPLRASCSFQLSTKRWIDGEK